MSEEVIAEVPAPEQVATAAPEPETVAPVEASEVESKTFTQEEMDAAIGKRLAREQRKWEREARQAEAPKPALVEHVKPEQFTTTEEYVDALTTSKAAQMHSSPKHRMSLKPSNWTKRPPKATKDCFAITCLWA